MNVPLWPLPGSRRVVIFEITFYVWFRESIQNRRSFRFRVMLKILSGLVNRLFISSNLD